MQRNKPKIFHLITRFIKGGAEAKTVHEIFELKDKYDYHLCFGPEFNRDEINLLKDNNIKVNEFFFLRHYNSLSLFFSIFEIYRYIKQNNFDIVHTHESEAGIVGRIAAKMAKTPIIVHSIHGTPFGRNRLLFLNKFLIFCERIAEKFTDKYISSSEVITQRFLKYNIGCNKKFQTIYSGIDISKYQCAKPKKIPNIPEDSIKILIASRLTRGKGLRELIKAGKQIVKEMNNVSFLIAGDGELKYLIKYLIEQEDLKDYFYLLGYRNDLERVMKSVDVFVLPSYKEGTPRVITEAMASGLPIIATNIDGIPEQVEHGKNGILIDPKNVVELAQAILKLLKNEDLRNRMGRESFRRVKKFSLERMLEDIDSLYQILINDKRLN